MGILEYKNALEENAVAANLRNLGSLADDMVYRLPGCDDVMVRKTLQAACREFCEKTSALRFCIPVPFEVGRHEYPVMVPCDCHARAVRDVRFFFVPPAEEGHEEMRPAIILADRKWTTMMTVGIGLVVVFPGVITDEFLATRTGFIAEVDCIPGPNSEDLPAPFLDKFGMAIVAGALARLYAMRNRPWSDESQAASERVSFERAVNEAAFSAIGPRGVDAVNYGGWA